jgi:hypothetical protein
MAQPQESHSKRLTVAVIGDSRATNYAADESVKAFPDVLAELAGDHFEVRNFARVAWRLDKYLKDFDEITDWRPDIVVNAFGGREGMYRLPKYLKRFPCDPTGSIRGTSWGKNLPMAWLRRQAWRGVVYLLQNRPAAGERVMQMMKANVYRTPEQYRQALLSLMERLSPWRPQTVFMLPLITKIGEHPYSPSAKAAIAEVSLDVAAQFPDLISTWDPKTEVDFSGHFLPDRVHLTAEGHRLCAESLLRALAELMGSQTGSDVRTPISS